MNREKPPQRCLPLTLGKQACNACGWRGGHGVPWYERRTISGRLMEVERYYATRDGRKISRSANVEESDDGQKVLNDRQAKNRLRRIILANFSPEDGDMHVTFTVSGEASRKTLDAMWKSFMAKLKAERRKRGLPECKWVKVPHCQSGRWHFHVVMSGGMELNELQELWGKQHRMSFSVLNLSDNYRGLCNYLLDEEKPRKGETEGSARQQRAKYKRRWSCSKNLAKPVVKKREISKRTVMQDPKAPKGYYLLPGWIKTADKFENRYSYFECVWMGPMDEKPKRRGRNAVRRDGTGSAPAREKAAG